MGSIDYPTKHHFQFKGAVFVVVAYLIYLEDQR